MSHFVNIKCMCDTVNKYLAYELRIIPASETDLEMRKTGVSAYCYVESAWRRAPASAVSGQRASGSGHAIAPNGGWHLPPTGRAAPSAGRRNATPPQNAKAWHPGSARRNRTRPPALARWTWCGLEGFALNDAGHGPSAERKQIITKRKRETRHSCCVGISNLLPIFYLFFSLLFFVWLYFSFLLLRFQVIVTVPAKKMAQHGPAFDSLLAVFGIIT